MNYTKVKTKTLRVVATEGDCNPLTITWKGKHVPASSWAVHSHANGGYRLLLIPNGSLSEEQKDTLEDMRKDPQVKIVE